MVGWGNILSKEPGQKEREKKISFPYCYISSYSKHCRMFFFSEKARQTTGKHTEVSTATSSLRNKEPLKCIALQFSLQGSWAPESCIVCLCPSATGQGTFSGTVSSPAHRQPLPKFRQCNGVLNRQHVYHRLPNKEWVRSQKEQGLKPPNFLPTFGWYLRYNARDTLLHYFAQIRPSSPSPLQVWFCY